MTRGNKFKGVWLSWYKNRLLWIDVISLRGMFYHQSWKVFSKSLFEPLSISIDCGWWEELWIFVLLGKDVDMFQGQWAFLTEILIFSWEDTYLARVIRPKNKILELSNFQSIVMHFTDISWLLEYCATRTSAIRPPNYLITRLHFFSIDICSDVFKAVALGTKGVCTGIMWIWQLTIDE